jgi:hypothetical protein
LYENPSSSKAGNPRRGKSTDPGSVAMNSYAPFPL